MDRVRVVSSNLYSVGYDPSSSILEIQFISGAVYRYFRVGVSVYEGLMSALSKGGYFAHVIRYAYGCERVA
jgi:KTSC domain